MKIALSQINPTVGDLAGNKQKIIQYIHQAKKAQVDVIVFPELCVCGYPPEDLLYKDHFVEDNIKTLKSLKKEVKGLTAIIGFVDKDKNKNLYNAAAVIDNGQLKGVYRKEELPNYGVFDEKRYFVSGRDNKIFSIAGKKVGVSICEDIWIKDGVCQRQVKEGAEMLINVSCSPYDVGKLKARESLLKKWAKKTGIFVCYVNIVGGQDELVFDGGSLVVDPTGKIVASAKQFEEDLVVFDLNENKSRALKASSQIERIYQALVLGTQDYAKKNGFKKVVIGISGGIDSALVAAIAVDAIGKENVIGITMPSRYTSKGTKTDAKRLADNLGIQLIEVSIEKIFKTYLSELRDMFKDTEVGLAEENVQARIRGNILMFFSNKYGWLVLTTGNKSEVAVGYCTLYGDMTGGFAVIKDVPKTKVFELATFRNMKENSPFIPESIIKRPPSAELRANQKDQDSLPPYDTLDEMLKGYVENHESLAQMSKKNKIELVKKIINMVDRSEYKRRQAPPGIKITPRAFGKDWRLPITNKYREF